MRNVVKFFPLLMSIVSVHAQEKVVKKWALSPAYHLCSKLKMGVSFFARHDEAALTVKCVLRAA